MSVSIFSEGNEYISASRAAEKIGYASDYIGQLCRAKKIPGKLIGRTWYVDFAFLTEHKKNQQFGKTKKSITYQSVNQQPQSTDPHNLKPQISLEKSSEIIMPRLSNNSVFTYENEDRPRLPELSKKARYVAPVWNTRLVKEAAAISLALLIAISAGFATLEHTAPQMATEVRHILTTVPSGLVTNKLLIVATPILSRTSKFFDDVVVGFRSLKEIALNKIFRMNESFSDYGAPLVQNTLPVNNSTAVTEVTEVLNLNTLKNELKV